MKNWLRILLLITPTWLFAQAPQITNVQRIVSTPFSTVEITGSGFSATAADLQVWFGNVRGTIVSSTATSITARVPAQARLSSVEVIKVTNRLSGRFVKKFMPTFSGQLPFTNSFTRTFDNSADEIFDLCTCDFDNDGDTDIAGSKKLNGLSNIFVLRNTSTVAANNTTLDFTPASVALAFPTFSLTCGDVNGDGRPEIIASRGGSTTGNSIFILPNTNVTAGTISFGAAIQLDLPVGDFAREVAVHDLNGDGKPEIVVTNSQTNKLYVFENKLTSAAIVVGDFTRNDITISGGTSSFALEVADVTNDGWPDILTTPSSNATVVHVLRNPGNGTLSFSSSTVGPISGTTNINDIAVADFNNNGTLDLVLSDRSANKALVMSNLSTPTVLAFNSVNGSTGFASPESWGVDVADMNGDGFADFITGNRVFANPEINVYINNGASTPSFTRNTIVSPKGVWFVKAGDYDGDSKPDIAATTTNNVTSFSVDVWKNANCHQAKILNDNPLTICNPQTLTLNAVPLQGVSFSWTGGNTGPTKNITVADVGTITVTAVGEGGACSTQASITVVDGGGSVPATPTINGPANGECSGNSIDLSTPNTAAEYEWDGPNFTSSVQDPPPITNVTTANAGTYRLRIKASGCYSNYATKEIQVVTPPSSITTNTAATDLCTGQSITLSVVNPSNDYDYQWKKAGTNVGTNLPTFTLNPVAEADQASYTVVASHKTISCSRETGALALNVFTMPVASFTKDLAQVCVGSQVTFNGTGSVVDTGSPAPTVNYSWSFGDSGSGTGATVQHTYSTANAVTVTLTVSYTGVTGCSDAEVLNFSVNAATPPVIEVNPDVLEICADGSETAELFVNGTFNSYNWTDGTTTATTPTFSISAPGTFALQTVDVNGCVGNNQIIISPKAGCDPVDPNELIVTIPKVFTPDKDGPIETENWIIPESSSYPTCTMTVFDGRGMKIYEVLGFPSDGWDGLTTSGKPAPEGTYFYVFGCPNGQKKTGTVLILR